uniref:Aquaporin n=1 Tax=Tetraselmis chuii TaxID=63592 RepID=A0A7S1T584_9CHLO|mmetsp:Transcript_6423/g.11585  ORF Transcript_6423/g.11585 Transcript_6423/m.11585 type:complete len:235 (+) Transcript_6423:130-834(+)
MPPVRLLLADLAVTAVWVFSTSFLSDATMQIVSATGASDLTVSMTLLVLGLLLMSPLCDGLGGACFNPAISVAFAAAGKEAIFETLLRTAFQTAGGVAGGYTAIYIHGEGGLKELSIGLRPGVSLTEGAVCEFILTFLSCITVVWSVGMKSKTTMLTAQLGSAVLLILGGLNYTGPSMNPAVSFCWFWHYEGHTVMEHGMVFWVAPIVGAVLAGMLCIETKVKTKHGKRKPKMN